MGKNRKTMFFGVFCICVIFACSKTEEIDWVKSNNVTVAWDATTSFEDGTPITPDIELRYNVYIDRDTGIRLPPPDYRCYTITGITVRMHVPSHISTEPEWCLAPRFKGDLVEHECSSEARLTTWGNIKARYSDQPTIR